MRSKLGHPASGEADLDVLVEEIAELRPLSPIAAQVLQIAERDNFSAHELAQAISSDPALTARVLRAANSAYYGFPRRITTVRDAVVLLGFRQIRSAALAACVVRSMPSPEGIEPEPFWRHSVTIGMLGEILARAEGYPNPHEAFTAGVLHNLGRMALDQVRPSQFRHARTLAAQRGISLHEAEREVFGFTDAEVGGALALRWQFPPDLALAIARHADPPGALGEGRDLAQFISRARAFARSRGITDGVDAVPAQRPPVSPYRAVMAAMSPLDLPAPEADPVASSGSPEPLELLVQEQGGVDALIERAAAFVEHTAAGG